MITEVDFLEVAEFNLGRAASIEAGKRSINFPRLLAILGAGVKVQELRLNPAPAETPQLTTWQDKGEIVAEPSRDAETKSATAEETNPTVYGFPAETKSTSAELTVYGIKSQAGIDAVAEKILGAFKNEDDTRTDADLLAASGLNREEYLDVRDFLLIETEEISETAEDTAPTEYVRNWPRKTQAAA